jgi:hypothetical protein
MNPRPPVVVFCTLACAALLAPAAAGAHHGGDWRHRHHHWHFGVLLRGAVASVNQDDGTIAVKVEKATRGGRALVGNTVGVKVLRAWVADANDDGHHDIADIAAGDTVIVWTKRRFIDGDGNAISAAKVFDKTRAPSFGAFRARDRDGDRDHDCGKR